MFRAEGIQGVLVSTLFHRRKKKTENKVRELIAKVDGWLWITDVLRSLSAVANLGMIVSSVERK